MKPWKLVEGPKVVKATVKLAQEISQMPGAPHDRPIKDQRLDRLRTLFRNGQFRSAEWVTAYCNETKELYRINGKHTSIVLSELLAGSGAVNNIPIIFTKYECETLENVAKLYASFDSRISARSSNDINKVFAAADPELENISIRTLSMAVSGLALHLWGEDCFNRSAEDRATLILSHKPFMLFLSNLISGPEHKHIARAPVAAAIAGSYYKNQQEAKKFWTLVRDETSTNRDAPDRALARYLRTVTVNIGRGATGTGKHNVSRREVMVKCIHAWNAWRRGQATDLKYYPMADIPQVA